MNSFTSSNVACVDLVKAPSPIRSGIGFLDHMIDQINSHAQVGVGLTVHRSAFGQPIMTKTTNGDEDSDEVMQEGDDDGDDAIVIPEEDANRNRFADNDGNDQSALLKHVGWTLGSQLSHLPALTLTEAATTSSRFCCPLDEALVECILTKRQKETTIITEPAAVVDTDENETKRRKLNPGDKEPGSTSNGNNTGPSGALVCYELAPFGSFPKGKGREHIGKLQTSALQAFWYAVAKSSGLDISLRKLRGHNGHHIVESSFKAFSRAFRNLLDGTTTSSITNTNHHQSTRQQATWGTTSVNWRESLALTRSGKVERTTKETSIQVALDLDAGTNGVRVHTGIETLDRFFTELAQAASLSLTIQCTGDLWVDDHHTAEDVAIAVGQVLNQALGSKAGLNRMWCAQANVSDGSGEVVEVTMDLSNRPCLVHNLPLMERGDEYIGDLSVEMMDHVLESLVTNGRMTVHVVAGEGSNLSTSLHDQVMATAVAFGRALKFCAMVDQRRAGKTASSKGTLSV